MMIKNHTEMIARSLVLYQHITGCAMAENIEGRKWKHADNWAYGSIGRAQITAKLYRHTGDPVLWDDLLSQLAAIEQRSMKMRSANYTLYFGRMGLASLYKMIFDTTGQQSFLTRAANMAKEYDSRPLQFHDKSSLAEGTAGFLLFCLSIYPVIQEQWLLDILHRHMQLLIDQARWDEKGIYWKGNGAGGRCYAGLAYGGSGIALSLLTAAQLFGDKNYLHMAALVMQFEDSFTKQAANDDWNAKGLMYGEAGKSLVRLYRGWISGNKVEMANSKASLLSLASMASDYAANAIPLGMADGLCGWGMALYEAYALTKDNAFLDGAQYIGLLLMNKTSSDTDISRNNASFMNGLTGIAYLLAQLHAPDDPGFLILPNPAHCRKNAIRLPEPGKRLLSRLLRRSVQMLEKAFPTKMAAFFEHTPMPSPADLVWFAKALDRQQLSAHQLAALNKILEKEYFMTTIDRRLHHRLPRGNNKSIFKLSRIFELSREDFLSLNLVITKDLLLLDQEDPLHLDLNKPIPMELLSYLFTAYGHKTFLFKTNKHDFLEEYTLGPLRLFADLFAVENTVGAALNRFIAFVNVQNKEVWEGMKAALRCDTDSHLLNELRGIFFRSVRALLIKGVLECTNLSAYGTPENGSGAFTFIGLAAGHLFNTG